MTAHRGRLLALARPGPTPLGAIPAALATAQGRGPTGSARVAGEADQRGVNPSPGPGLAAWTRPGGGSHACRLA
jgi:hypothetical protein